AVIHAESPSSCSVQSELSSTRSHGSSMRRDRTPMMVRLTDLRGRLASHQGVVEAAVAVLDDVLAGLVLQPGGRAGWVGFEEGWHSMPSRSVFEMRVLGHGVDEVDVGVASDVAP